MNIFPQLYLKINFWIRDRVEKLDKKIAIFLMKLIRSPSEISRFPHLIKIGNPSIGRRLVEGDLIIGRVLLEFKSDSPWNFESPSIDFQEALHGFQWLNDLSAYGNLSSKKLCFKWIIQWFDLYGDGSGPGWTPEIVARRLTNISRNAGFFLKLIDPKTNRELFVKLNKQIFFLKAFQTNMKGNLAKIRVVYALLSIQFTIGKSRHNIKSSLGKFCKQLIKTFDEKGYICSRSPEDLLEIFIMISEVLYFWKEAKLNNNKDKKLLLDYQRDIAPMIRGLRLGNGCLTRAHGGDSGLISVIDKVLADSGVRSGPLNRNIMGFERIAAGRLVLLTDCYKPPRPLHSRNAHSACFSFELSSGQRPVFVNCGPGRRFGLDYHRYCRSTRAHNTSVLGNNSQSDYQIIRRGNYQSEELIVRCPKKITVSRAENLDAIWLELSHDGYTDPYGFVHERKLTLLKSGKAFSGVDIFRLTTKRSFQTQHSLIFSSYFHLHPEVEVWDHPRLQTIILRLKNGEHWIFETDLGEVSLEDSTYIDDYNGVPVYTKAIVVNSPPLAKYVEIKWSLRRREIVSRNTRDGNIVQEKSKTFL